MGRYSTRLVSALLWVCCWATVPARAGDYSPCSVSVQHDVKYTLLDPGWARALTGTIVTLQNPRVAVDIELTRGNICRYVDKSRPDEHPFSRLDENLSPTGAWEADGFSYVVNPTDAAHASVIIFGTGRVRPRSADAAAAAIPVAIRRIITVDATSTRVRVDLTITNTGDRVIPNLRCMVHSIYSYPMLPGPMVYAFLAGPEAIEVFDHERIVKANHIARVPGADPASLRWSAPGASLDKARYPALGFAAMYCGSGWSYISYDPGQFDFVGLWTGTHPSEWLTIEPNTKAVDLAPNQSLSATYRLASDIKDVAVRSRHFSPSPPPGSVAAMLGGASDVAPAPSAASGASRPAPVAIWTNSLGMQLTTINPDIFVMGASDDDRDAEPDEMPAHAVRLSQPFQIGRYLVTNKQMRLFKPGFHSHGPGGTERKPLALDADDQPAIVNWETAKAFCAWLQDNDKSRPAGWTYGLPTEAQWEYAARGPQRLRYPWGNAWDATKCNFGDLGETDGFVGTSPVGSFSPAGDSPFGLTDMAGNLWQWCEDFYDEDYYRRIAPGAADLTRIATDPVNTDATLKYPMSVDGHAIGKMHVLRGGSYGSLPSSCRCGFRFGMFATGPAYTGFRVVLAKAP